MKKTLRTVVEFDLKEPFSIDHGTHVEYNDWAYSFRFEAYYPATSVLSLPLAARRKQATYHLDMARMLRSNPEPSRIQSWRQGKLRFVP